jgi:hypothetical protein
MHWLLAAAVTFVPNLGLCKNALGFRATFNRKSSNPELTFINGFDMHA